MKIKSIITISLTVFLVACGDPDPCNERSVECMDSLSDEAKAAQERSKKALGTPEDADKWLADRRKAAEAEQALKE